MVQNKTGMVSYKNHKQVSKPESEWIKVENTHKPLISQETWDAVQRMDNHPARGRSGKKAEITVSNTVDGAQSIDAARLFDRFYRADESHSNTVSGTGIGLSIAKATVDAHGGKISAKQMGNTITFQVTL